MWRAVGLLWLTAAGAIAQDEALARLQVEAVKLRTAKIGNDDADFDKALAPLRAAQRDWIESKLPKDRAEFFDRAGSLEEELERDLKAAKITPDDAPKKDDDPEGVWFGYLSVKVERLPELPDILFATVSATVGCGAEDSLYAYRFEANGWRRIIEDHPTLKWPMGDMALELSGPDGAGRRLLLVSSLSQQCASSWRALGYSVYQLDWQNGTAESLLSVAHDVWIDNDPIYVLTPDRLTVEFFDSSVSGDVHHRTMIQRYSFTPAARRIDPVALQPQDFAEEWLTRPWSEMESRSAPATKALHESFGGGFVLGDYLEVTQCAEEQPVWLAGFDIDWIGDKQLPKPRRVYLQMRDLGDHRYRMESASSGRPASCKAEPGEASEKYPWLSEEEIRKLK